ncbi:MAG: Rrf2 family transcriptional regulator [Actinobacteria bacterium]|nr:MAG: Rrf2 family transcriptional regulator [Actinomycetota bacterium]
MRLELNKRTDLALRAMQALCSYGDRLSGNDLAESLGTTHPYLPQIMSPLVRKRWVSSTSGPRGGYELVAQLGSVSVLELIETMEGATDTDTCVLSGEICDSTDPCALHGAWSQARDALLRELSSMSLADAWDAC